MLAKRIISCLDVTGGRDLMVNDAGAQQSGADA